MNPLRDKDSPRFSTGSRMSIARRASGATAVARGSESNGSATVRAQEPGSAEKRTGYIFFSNRFERRILSANSFCDFAAASIAVSNLLSGASSFLKLAQKPMMSPGGQTQGVSGSGVDRLKPNSTGVNW